MIDTRELYWAAGFLEGEGSFTRGIRSRSVAVEASQVQLVPLERLRTLFGGYLNLRNRSGKRRRQPFYVWLLRSRKAVGLMMTLYALMSPRRKQQILHALSWWRSCGVAPQSRQKCPQGHPLDGIVQRTTGRRKGRAGRYCKTCNRERTRLLATDHRARLARRLQAISACHSPTKT